MIVASCRTRERQETCSNNPRHLRPVRTCSDSRDTDCLLGARLCLWQCDRGGGKRWSEVWGMHWSLVQGVIFRRRVIIIASCWRRSMKMIRALRMTLYSLTQTREIPGGKWNWYLLNCEREERAEMRTTWSDAQSSGAWDERAGSIFLDSGKKLSAKKFVMLQ